MKTVNLKQWSILIGWFALIGIAHYLSEPTHGLIGTLVTVYVIAAIVFTFLHFEGYVVFK